MAPLMACFRKRACIGSIRAIRTVPANARERTLRTTRAKRTVSSRMATMAAMRSMLSNRTSCRPRISPASTAANCRRVSPISHLLPGALAHFHGPLKCEFSVLLVRNSGGIMYPLQFFIQGLLVLLHVLRQDFLLVAASRVSELLLRSAAYLLEGEKVHHAEKIDEQRSEDEHQVYLHERVHRDLVKYVEHVHQEECEEKQHDEVEQGNPAPLVLAAPPDEEYLAVAEDGEDHQHHIAEREHPEEAEHRRLIQGEHSEHIECHNRDCVPSSLKNAAKTQAARAFLLPLKTPMKIPF